MRRNSLSGAACPIARSLDVIGDWWSLLIVRDALRGMRRFSEFHKSLGVSKNILTRRLRTLVEQGILDEARSLVGLDPSLPAAKALGVPELVRHLNGEIGLADFIAANLMFESTFSFGYMKPMFERALLARHSLRYDETLRIGEDYILLASALSATLGAGWLLWAGKRSDADAVTK